MCSRVPSHQYIIRLAVERSTTAVHHNIPIAPHYYPFLHASDSAAITRHRPIKPSTGSSFPRQTNKCPSERLEQSDGGNEAADDAEAGSGRPGAVVVAGGAGGVGSRVRSGRGRGGGSAGGGGGPGGRRGGGRRGARGGGSRAGAGGAGRGRRAGDGRRDRDTNARAELDFPPVSNGYGRCALSPAREEARRR